MKDLFSENIKINSVEEIDNTIEKILNSPNEYFDIDIGQLEPIIFRFIGNRFNKDFIPLKTAEISVIYKGNFIKYYNNLLHTKIDENILFFYYKKGSFEIDFQQVLTEIVNKGISNMSGIEITLTILFGIGAWFAKESYSEYLEKEKAKFTNETAIKAIEALQQNIELQNAKNKPVNKAIEILENEEKLEYGNIKDKAVYSNNDIEKFNIVDDEYIIYDTITEAFYIKELKDKEGKKIVTLKRDKQAKFEAISKLDNNLPLYNSFDERKPIKLKIKIGKNQQGKIIEADIYELVN